MFDLIGKILILIGVLNIAFGIISILRFKNFYTRILISSKVDTVGFICVMTGVMIFSGLSYFTLKVAVILLTMSFISPIMTHYIARSAYNTGQKINEGDSYDT
jgi:multicomponent Na+:H+ antiporter subunit G